MSLVNSVDSSSQIPETVLDRFGVTVSAICAAHCLVPPLLLFSVPMLGEFFYNPVFHILIAVLVVPVALVAFYRGYYKHRNLWVVLSGAFGVIFIMGAVVAPTIFIGKIGHTETMLTGSGFLILAHAMNWHLLKKLSRTKACNQSC